MSVVRRDALLITLQSSVDANEGLRNAAQGMVQTATISGSMAQALYDVVAAAPDDSVLPPARWDQLQGSWQSQADHAVEAATNLSSASTVSPSTESAAFSTTLAPKIYSAWIGPKEKLAAETLQGLLHRPERITAVVSAMSDFRLNQTRPGTRPASELLNEAQLALNRPAGTTLQPTAALIPARESIKRTLADLVQRVPQQLKAGSAGAKVELLGAQCGRDGLPSTFFHRLGEDLAELLDQLSAVGKQQHTTDAEVRRLFDAVLMFLKSLFESLDPSKLRRGSAS